MAEGLFLFFVGAALAVRPFDGLTDRAIGRGIGPHKCGTPGGGRFDKLTDSLFDRLIDLGFWAGAGQGGDGLQVGWFYFVGVGGLAHGPKEVLFPNAEFCPGAGRAAFDDEQQLGRIGFFAGGGIGRGVV